MRTIESLRQLRGDPFFLGVGRMQIGMISPEESSSSLPYRVEIGTVG